MAVLCDKYLVIIPYAGSNFWYRNIEMLTFGMLYPVNQTRLAGKPPHSLSTLSQFGPEIEFTFQTFHGDDSGLATPRATPIRIKSWFGRNHTVKLVGLLGTEHSSKTGIRELPKIQDPYHVLKFFNFQFPKISHMFIPCPHFLQGFHMISWFLRGLDPTPIPPGYSKLLNGGWSCAAGYTGVVDGCCRFDDICMPRWMGWMGKWGKNGWKRHIGRWKIAGKLVWFLKFWCQGSAAEETVTVSWFTEGVLHGFFQWVKSSLLRCVCMCLCFHGIVTQLKSVEICWNLLKLLKSLIMRCWWRLTLSGCYPIGPCAMPTPDPCQFVAGSQRKDASETLWVMSFKVSKLFLHIWQILLMWIMQNPRESSGMDRDWDYGCSH